MHFRTFLPILFSPISFHLYFFYRFSPILFTKFSPILFSPILFNHVFYYSHTFYKVFLPDILQSFQSLTHTFYTSIFHPMLFTKLSQILFYPSFPPYIMQCYHPCFSKSFCPYFFTHLFSPILFHPYFSIYFFHPYSIQCFHPCFLESVHLYFFTQSFHLYFFHPLFFTHTLYKVFTHTFFTHLFSPILFHPSFFTHTFYTHTFYKVFTQTFFTHLFHPYFLLGLHQYFFHPSPIIFTKFLPRLF